MRLTLDRPQAVAAELRDALGPPGAGPACAAAGRRCAAVVAAHHGACPPGSTLHLHANGRPNVLRVLKAE